MTGKFARRIHLLRYNQLRFSIFELVSFQDKASDAVGVNTVFLQHDTESGMMRSVCRHETLSKVHPELLPFKLHEHEKALSLNGQKPQS